MSFQSVFDAFATMRQERTFFLKVRDQFLANPTPENGRQYDAASQRLIDNIVQLNSRLLEYHTELGEMIHRDLASVHRPISSSASLGGLR